MVDNCSYQKKEKESKNRVNDNFKSPFNVSKLEYTWRLNLEVVSNCLIQEERLKSWSSVLTWYPREKF